MKRTCKREDKCIAGMLRVKCGDISDKAFLENDRIDAIVNAANPTLMGSNQGVDGAIHTAINRILSASGQQSSFKNKIREEIDDSYDVAENTIRCQRGRAVTTKGYGLCKYVIHVVGAKFDGIDKSDTKRNYRSCSSSRIRYLESCYYSIVDEIKKYADIERIAVPIISSGEYGFPFQLAAKIAVASIGNALLEWKKKDSEMFELSGIKEVWFYIYPTTKEKQVINNEQEKYVEKILWYYRKRFRDDHKITYQSSFQSNFQILQEIKRYDEIRGYFSIAKAFRIILTYIRILCLFWTAFKDLIGREDWEYRRKVVEFLTVGKISIPIIGFLLLEKYSYPQYLVIFFQFLVVYSIIDTISYLLSLIVMTDIQRPSANIIRSLILLFVNYLEASIDISFLYYLYYRKQPIMFLEALQFGILGKKVAEISGSLTDYVFLYIGEGIKFFFITLALGYFAGHIKQRQFKS